MKVAVLGDSHVGARGDAPVFHRHQEKFFAQCFFPELEKRGITEIIQLGDLWDRRKYVSFTTLQESRRWLFDPMREKQLHMVTLLGNHDIALRESLRINSSEMLLGEYGNITVVTQPTELEYGSLQVLMVPWLCEENEKQVEEAIKRSKASMCFGHFELAGFQAFRGHVMEEGYQPGFLSRFSLVVSGHYHHRSQNHNILYAGTPYPMTWMDYGDQKGFHILDTETLELEFVPNPFELFHRIEYTDDLKIDPSKYTDGFVRVIADKKNNPFAFDKFIFSLQQAGPFELKIIDDIQVDVDAENVDLSLDDSGVPDTISVIESFVDNIQTNVDKDSVKKFMKQLLLESQMAQ